MAPIFAIRTDGRIFDNEIGIVVGWIVALGHQPAGAYCSVPQRLLPEGVSAVPRGPFDQVLLIGDKNGFSINFVDREVVFY
jgi:hypothetical protein